MDALFNPFTIPFRLTQQQIFDTHTTRTVLVVVSETCRISFQRLMLNGIYNWLSRLRPPQIVETSHVIMSWWVAGPPSQIRWSLDNGSQFLSIVFRLIGFADFAYILHISVSRCKCVSAFCVNLRSLVAKILKNHLFGFGYFQSNGASRVLLLLDTNLHFQGQSFDIFLFANIFETVRDIANITIVVRYEVEHLTSNGATATVMHHGLDLYFQGHEIWKRWELAKNVKVWLL